MQQTSSATTTLVTMERLRRWQHQVDNEYCGWFCSTGGTPTSVSAEQLLLQSHVRLTRRRAAW